MPWGWIIGGVLGYLGLVVMCCLSAGKRYDEQTVRLQRRERLLRNYGAVVEIGFHDKFEEKA